MYKYAPVGYSFTYFNNVWSYRPHSYKCTHPKIFHRMRACLHKTLITYDVRVCYCIWMFDHGMSHASALMHTYVQRIIAMRSICSHVWDNAHMSSCIPCFITVKEDHYQCKMGGVPFSPYSAPYALAHHLQTTMDWGHNSKVNEHFI